MINGALVQLPVQQNVTNPHSTVRFSMVPYGSLWISMVPYGSLWFSMVSVVQYGSIWFGTVQYRWRKRSHDCSTNANSYTTEEESLQDSQITCKKLFSAPKSPLPRLANRVSKGRNWQRVRYAAHRKARHPFLCRHVAFYSALNAYDKQGNVPS